MKTILSFFYLLSLSFVTLAQSENEAFRILKDYENKEIFDEVTKKKLDIDFPIYRTYNYKDQSGEYYLVLTEKVYKTEDDNPLNKAIKGYLFKKEGTNLSLVWKMKDFIVEENKADTEEYSIWFWTNYFDLQDFDQDGLVDPVIIYGTSGMNGTDDGRIKILTYYKGVKRAIRHQNGTLDHQRKTQVDKEFSSLPSAIKNHVYQVMKKMVDKEHAIFEDGYEGKMKVE